MSTLALILSGSAIFFALSPTPAFNPQARFEGLYEDWRLSPASAMYDPGTYAFQHGHGLLLADAVPYTAEDGQRALASAKTALERATSARDALVQSTRLDPANAHAWAALAWAYIRLNKDQQALEALQASWYLAPFNTVLADTRVNLASLLFDPTLYPTAGPVSDTDSAHIKNDLQTLSRFDRSSLEYFQHVAPFLVPVDMHL